MREGRVVRCFQVSVPEHLNVVGPKLSLSVELSLSLSLSQNFACHSKFRVCVPPRAGAYFTVGLRLRLLYDVARKLQRAEARLWYIASYLMANGPQ